MTLRKNTKNILEESKKIKPKNSIIGMNIAALNKMHVYREEGVNIWEEIMRRKAYDKKTDRYIIQINVQN